MTVDKAGSKVTDALLALGLIFVVICECHCLAIVGSMFNERFSKPKRGKYSHPSIFLHGLISLIRKHVGVQLFFCHTAYYSACLLLSARPSIVPVR